MFCDYKSIDRRISCAVREGKLELARNLFDEYRRSRFFVEKYVLLREAAESNLTEIAKILLTDGCKVNSKGCLINPTNTPLHFAALHGNTDIVKMLLNKDANVFVKNRDGRTPIFNAIKSNNIEVIELLLKHGAIVNGIDKWGEHPLHIAVKTKSLKIVELILENGALVNCECTSIRYKGYTPLHFAVENDTKEIITLLLNRGANVNVKAKNSITPLHIAAKKGYTHITEELLNHGAYINSLTLEEFTPLYTASAEGCEETVKLLLSRGADVNASAMDNLKLLHIATKRGNETIVKLLLQHGAKVDNEDKDGKTILHLAVETGNLMIVEDVLKYCPDVNNQSNRSSLKYAVYYKAEKIVQALLEYGLTLGPDDTNNAKLLHVAVEKGYLKIVEDLLKNGADVNIQSCGITPLHTAAKNEQDVIAKLLINYEADINAQDQSGKTPIFYAIENAGLKMTKLLLANNVSVKDNPKLLHLAVIKICIKIVEILLQHDVDVNASDAHGRTALYFNSCNSRSYFFLNVEHCDISMQDLDIKGKIAELLLCKGANVNAQTKDGQTALYTAIKNGFENIVETLLKYNVNLNSALKIGKFPLYVAAEMGNEEIIRMLLKKGADVNARRKDGNTLLHIAVDERNDEVVKILLKYDADINAQNYKGRTAIHLAFERMYGTDGIDHFQDSCDDSTDWNWWEQRCDCNDYYSSDDSFDYICNTFCDHVLKMKTANLYVTYINLSFLNSVDTIYFQIECEEEIEKMRNEKINNVKISFYDIFARDTNTLAKYMRNENLVQILKSEDYKSKFPIYADMIQSYFRKVMKRKELLDQVNVIIYFIFKNLPELPDDCIDKILSYLSDEDLRIIMDACNYKPLSISNPKP